ncbi:hypothetical protein TraAM80_07131 [Trypanosoma rangeli]|uniref:Uncharacterized protein n=1 Tax=Trypanosoma rangeli TaxID=5698 RepID=A0A3R7K3T6_TRYRA|nr:uncharacterized protein TraAM80_07131 [Trypanosoma rangeli]RNF01231.1 hypothetical protein TraAM80_07131 [Trypanosoma rangeli]|eukprot:RNF01231.1 hypothetical protein TraAM80_07131 [Trypanosoma rangeli]
MDYFVFGVLCVHFACLPQRQLGRRVGVQTNANSEKNMDRAMADAHHFVPLLAVSCAGGRWGCAGLQREQHALTQLSFSVNARGEETRLREAFVSRAAKA